MSSSCRTSNVGAGIGGKSSIVAWEKGEESEFVSSGNEGMAAAVLSPGGLFLNKINVVLYINHFHVSLAHAQSSVLQDAKGCLPVDGFRRCTVPRNSLHCIGDIWTRRY